MKKLDFVLFIFTFVPVAQTQQITVNNVQPTSKQGNGTKFQLAGTVSGSGIPLCTDANGNTTTSLCPGTFTVPLPVNAGGTGVNTLTINGVLFGNGTGNINGTIAGSQYQVLQPNVSGTPFWGPLNLGQAAAITGILPSVNVAQIPLATGVTGILPKVNYVAPDWSDILGAKQGNTNVPQMAGTNSGVSGVNLCNDVNGNTTTNGCPVPFILPSGTQTQYFQITPNTGNNTTYQFASKPYLVTSEYNFPSQTPGGSLSIGAQTITLTPCPLGVSED